MNVAIVDYGVGNLRSLERGLERAGATVSISDDPSEIAAADAIVLPGVGAYEECIRNSRPFHRVLTEAAEGTPMLGICVGLQMMFTESAEGARDGETIEGLDLFEGRVERLPNESVKVPHMGWNELAIEADHPLLEGIDDGDVVYFVHSYASAVAEHTLASCDYGFEFAAIASNEPGNVVGTQFHPEKSGTTGLRILRNFVTIARRYHDERVTVS